MTKKIKPGFKFRACDEYHDTRDYVVVGKRGSSGWMAADEDGHQSYWSHQVLGLILDRQVARQAKTNLKHVR